MGVVSFFGLKLCLCLLLVVVDNVLCFDLSWIPADPHAPLPLSANYRKSLRSLCKLLSSKDTLNKELEAKRPVLQIMCKQLQEDDAAGSGTSDYFGSDNSSPGYLGAIVCALIAIAFAHHFLQDTPSYRKMRNWGESLFNRKVDSHTLGGNCEGNGKHVGAINPVSRDETGASCTGGDDISSSNTASTDGGLNDMEHMRQQRLKRFATASATTKQSE